MPKFFSLEISWNENFDWIPIQEKRGVKEIQEKRRVTEKIIFKKYGSSICMFENAHVVV